MTRDELIAALEKATAPDRELDAELHEARFPELRSAPWVSRGGVWVDTSSEDPNMAFPAQYTNSLDAALTLVPEGWEWLRKSELSMTVYRVPDDDKTWARHIDGAHKTAAIALCIAALKARA